MTNEMKNNEPAVQNEVSEKFSSLCQTCGSNIETLLIIDGKTILLSSHMDIDGRFWSNRFGQDNDELFLSHGYA